MSLGYRPRHDHIAARRPISSATTPTLPIESSSAGSSFRCIPQCIPVPRGLVPTVAYSLVALAIPLLCFFTSPDFTADEVVAVTIGLSGVGGLVVIFANDCCCWYNMMLFFHIGVEAKVVDLALTYAYDDANSERDQTLAMVAGIVIILHLIPFLLTDRIMLLIFLAYVGVVVNTSAIVYLASEQLLLVVASSLALLSTTMIVGGICEIKTSLASLFMDSIKKKKCITCESFEL